MLRKRDTRDLYHIGFLQKNISILSQGKNIESGAARHIDSAVRRVCACVRAREIIIAKSVVKKLTKVDTKGMYPKVTGKKRKLAEMLCNPDIDMTVTDICKTVKVSRQTFYNWQQDPNFMGYVEFLINSFTDSELPKAWKTLVRRATVDGNIDALKLFFAMKDKYSEQAAIQNNVVIIDGADNLED